MLDDTDEDDQQVVEFDLPLLKIWNFFDLHGEIHHRIDLDPTDKILNNIFHMVAAVCDPFTQPEDNDRMVLSVDCLADVVVALAYQMVLHQEVDLKEDDAEDTTEDDTEKQAPILYSKEAPDVASLRFTLSLKFFQILEALHLLLRADDELRVRYLHNDRQYWDATAKFWLPVFESGEEPLLKLCYYMCCVLIMAIYKLFGTALHPYSDYFLRLWKTHTSIIALALEMDRELEEEAWATKGEYFDTPENIKQALLGSSAVRTVLAWILNRASVEDDDDLKNEAMLNFFDPLERTKRHCGALVADERLFMVAMLVLRLHVPFSPILRAEISISSDEPGVYFPMFDSDDFHHRGAKRVDPMGAAGDLVVDLYYEDQFDEDIKYVFGYFDSDDESSDENEPPAKSDIAMALRSDNNALEFDEQGRDWRDCARGDNVDFSDAFLELEAQYNLLAAKEASDHFFTSWDELHKALDFLALMEIENVEKFMHRVGQVIVNTVAKAVKDEIAEIPNDINPDRIYKFLVSPASAASLQETYQQKSYIIAFRKMTNFELILINNPQVAFAVIDELLMCKGFRRTLIWFLTHNVNLHMTLINYVYELVMGLRGNPDGTAAYKFSRKGDKLELSTIEQLMLLHELFINGSSWLLQGEYDTSAELPELRAKKLVSYFCLMILRLTLKNVILLDRSKTDYFEDYSQDIQVLLFPWIGKVPEARDLFFRIKREMYQDPEEEPVKPTLTEPKDIDEVLSMLRELPDHKVYAYTMTHAHVRAVLTEFGDRLALHLFSIYKIGPQNDDEKDTDAISRDFHTFLTHFEEFARCKVFVTVVFNHLEDHVVGHRPSMKEGQDEVEEDGGIVDSEFNDEFLNGEGQFQENSEKSDSKKKTKKKKKKKGKKK